MALSEAYLAWEQAAEKRGEMQAKREGIEALLKVRFGEPDEDLLAIVPQLLTLTADEYNRLILRSSREDLHSIT